MLKSFPKILIIAFLAILFFQISSVEAAESYQYYQKSLGVNCAGLGGQTSVPITDCQNRNVTPPNDCIRPGQNIEDLCFCCYFNSTPTPTPASTQTKSTGIQFIPQVPIPGYNFDNKDTGTGNIAKLVRAIYNYAIGIVGILAAVVLMVGGVLWIVAGGNSSQVGEAKAYIGAALTGLLLALTSYLILTTVNPALVDLKTTGINSVAKYIGGSCLLIEPTAEGKLCIDNTTKENCGKYSQFREGIACPAPCCAYDQVSMLKCPTCGEAYFKCIDYQQFLTAEICSGKDPGKKSYLPEGKCQVKWKNFGMDPLSICVKSGP